MAIFFYSEQVEVPPLLKLRTKIFLKTIITDENYFCGEISIIFCSDKFLLNINKKYLQHNYYTDILSFDYSTGKVASGDIYISVERVTENADKYNVSFIEELYRIMFHGILHLLGYSDKNEKDKEIMTLKEDHYLKLFFGNN